MKDDSAAGVPPSPSGRRIHPNLRWTLRSLSIVLGLYVVSYMVLSIQGVYGWGAIGSNGVKYWRWYPKGFGLRNPQQAQFLRFFYAPLDWLDGELWHEGDDVYDKPKSPIYNGFPP